MDYNGGRTKDTIIEWLNKKAGPVSAEVDCAAMEAKTAEALALRQRHALHRRLRTGASDARRLAASLEAAGAAVEASALATSQVQSAGVKAASSMPGAAWSRRRPWRADSTTRAYFGGKSPACQWAR